MKTVKLTLSFEYDKNLVCNAVNMILSRMNLPTMNEDEIIAQFCKEEATIIPIKLTEDINMLSAYICMMMASDTRKFDET